MIMEDEFMQDDGDKYGKNRRRKPSERRAMGVKEKNGKAKKGRPCGCFGNDMADMVDFEFLKDNTVAPEEGSMVCA